VVIAFVGSRKKAEVLKARLAERGVSAKRLSNLKAPAGLDLGAITPDEIAISILAEIVAVRRGKHSRGGAASDAVRRSQRAADVVRPYVGGEAVVGVVGHAEQQLAPRLPHALLRSLSEHYEEFIGTKKHLVLGLLTHTGPLGSN
jgi:hypothetical protein